MRVRVCVRARAFVCMRLGLRSLCLRVHVFRRLGEFMCFCDCSTALVRRRASRPRHGGTNKRPRLFPTTLTLPSNPPAKEKKRRRKTL